MMRGVRVFRIVSRVRCTVIQLLRLIYERGITTRQDLRIGLNRILLSTCAGRRTKNGIPGGFRSFPRVRGKGFLSGKRHPRRGERNSCPGNAARGAGNRISVQETLLGRRGLRSLSGEGRRLSGELTRRPRKPLQKYLLRMRFILFRKESD